VGRRAFTNTSPDAVANTKTVEIIDSRRAVQTVVLAVIFMCVAGLGGSAAARPVDFAEMLAFDARPYEPGNYGWQVFVGEVATGRVQRLVGIDGAISPSWSPDGSEVVYEQHGQVWRFDSSGSHRRRLTSKLQRSESPDWGNTGRIAFLRWLPSKGSAIETDIFTIESELGRSPAVAYSV
jgi:hypothetical protein